MLSNKIYLPITYFNLLPTAESAQPPDIRRKAGGRLDSPDEFNKLEESKLPLTTGVDCILLL